MGMDIINLTQYADALRSTGYKNIESAISEIIDNSVEAKAKNIFIIIKETLDEVEGKNKVTEIAFLDNGNGMDKDLVQGCLRIGYGTRTKREGIGRFGVGLPQASMHVCPLVEVYSWQDYEKPYKSYLNINKIKSGEQTSIEEPIQQDIPEDYKKYLSYEINNSDISFKRNGTLIVWKNCDNVTPRKVATLTERLVFELGKKFRHIIKSDKCSLYIIDTKNDANSRRIKPNDPLLLMEDNYILGNSSENHCTEWIKDDESFNEPIFMPYEGKNNEFPNGLIKKRFKYIDKNTKEEKESLIKIRFSVVKPEFYDIDHISGSTQPGDGAIGKEIKKLEGISIVRADREIDFGKFDFYSNINTPIHRWWGCEISFGTELDEVFGVSNNKQHVELIAIKEEDFIDDDIKPVWLELNAIIKPIIANMVSRNKALRKGSKPNTKSTLNKSKSIEIIQIVDQSKKNTNTNILKQNNYKEALKEAMETLKGMGINSPTKEEIKTVIDRKVNFVYINDKYNLKFFEIEVERGISKCIVNKQHEMYKMFLKDIVNDEPNLAICFELFIGSLVRVKDEMIEWNTKSIFDEILENWNKKFTMFIKRFANS